MTDILILGIAAGFIVILFAIAIILVRNTGKRLEKLAKDLENDNST